MARYEVKKRFILRRLKRLKPFRVRFAVLLMAFALGVGADSYIRNESSRGRHCYGCTSWHCQVVNLADNPQFFLRAYWRELTE